MFGRRSRPYNFPSTTAAERAGCADGPSRRLPSLLGICRRAWQQSAQGKRTEPETHQLLGTVGFMLRTARLQHNTDLDRTHVRALHQLLRLLGSRLHTQSQACVMLGHCTALTAPCLPLVQLEWCVCVSFLMPWSACMQRIWCRHSTCTRCRRAVSVLQAALRPATAVRCAEHTGRSAHPRHHYTRGRGRSSHGFAQPDVQARVCQPL